ncbi:MAG: NAD-dependent epimerase/dehydratase family protein, partial [Actinomycetes bacterium]
GRRAVPRLVEAGHHVTGVARSADKAAWLRRVGAEPVTMDLFDPAAVRAAVDGHEVVINLATNIPPPSRAARPSAWSDNDRIRSEASRHLVDAAAAAGARRFVQESIAFIYPEGGDRWIDEDVPLDPPPLGRANVAAEAQAQRFAATGAVGVVLRFGGFYAWEAAHTRFMRRLARWRLPAMPGPPAAYSPAIAADDAASAVVASLHAPGGTWNVTDDDPMTRRAFNRMVADTLGARPPIGTGTTLLRLSPNTRFYLRSQRVANRRFKDATGWAPRYPDAAAGWRAMAAEGPTR